MVVPHKVIVVVPTYNEARNLAELADALFRLPIEGLEMMVIDDGSPDGTGQIAEELALQRAGKVHVVHRAGKLGLGTAYVEGYKRALAMGADFVLQMDADFSHDPRYVPTLLDAAKGADVAVGSRYVRGGGSDPTWGWRRRALSGWGNWYARRVTGLKVKDVTSGFKCFRRGALEALDLGALSSQGFGFQVEVAYACQGAGLRAVEAPIIFYERRKGFSKMSFGIVWEALWKVWQVRFSRRTKRS